MSGGVEFDVVVRAERTELVTVSRRRLTDQAKVYKGLLGVGFTGVDTGRVSGEFGRVACRKFPEFVQAARRP